jgi:hypothetical protein
MNIILLCTIENKRLLELFLLSLKFRIYIHLTGDNSKSILTAINCFTFLIFLVIKRKNKNEINIYVRNDTQINLKSFLKVEIKSNTIYYGDSIVKYKEKDWYEARPIWSPVLFEQYDYLGDILICAEYHTNILNYLSQVSKSTKIDDQIIRIPFALAIRKSDQQDVYSVPIIYDSHVPMKMNQSKLNSKKNSFSIIIPTIFKKNRGIFSIISCINDIISNLPAPKEIIITCHVDYLENFYILKNIFTGKIEISLYSYNYQFNFSRVINEASQQCSYDNLIIINDDVYLSQFDKECAMQHLETQGVGAVGARLYYPSGKIQHDAIEFRNHQPENFLQGSEQGFLSHVTKYCREVGGVTGAFVLIKKSIFHRVGGLDEKFPVDYGDVDFMLKLIENKLSVVRCSGINAVHFESLSRENFYEKSINQKLIDLTDKWGVLGLRDEYLITLANRINKKRLINRELL